MSIRTKAFVIIGLILIGALLFQYYVANHILLSSFNDLEKQEVQENVQRAGNAVGEQLTSMEQTVKDWAYWDETYLFMQDNNEDYVVDNLAFDTLANLDLDMMLFVNTNTSIHHVKIVDLGSGDDLALPEQLNSYIYPQSQLLPSSELLDVTKGLLEVEPETYMLVVAAQILTNDSTGPSQGYLILGRYLNPQRIAAFTETTRLNFTFLPANSSEGRKYAEDIYASPFNLNTPMVTVLNSKENIGTIGLSDVFGQPAVILKLAAERDIYQHGRSTFLILFGLMMAIMVIGAIVLMFLLEKVVLARLSHLSEMVSQISDRDDITISVTGNDEIATLGKVVDTILKGLHESKSKLHVANQTLESKVVERTKQLEQSIKYTEAILDSSSDALVSTDNDGCIIQINPAFTLLFGYTDSEVKTLHIWDIVTQESIETLRQNIHNMVHDRQSRRIEVMAKRQDGTTFNADFAISVLITGDDLVFGGVASIRDISQQKLIEDNLRDALAKERELRDLKSRFISMASHEFRTPLAVIQASTDILNYYSEQLNSTQKSEHFDKIFHQIQHMADLLDQVLTLNRQDFREVDFHPVPTNLDTLCQEIVDDFKLATNATHGQRYACLGESKPIMVDPSLIRHAINNLVSNGVKYSPKGSTIDMKLIYKERQVEISVSDQGIGIPEQDRKYLFQPFHRAQNVGTIQGTGLGLSITKQAIEMHGGTISVESQEGVGTTFSVTIPLLPSKEMDS